MSEQAAPLIRCTRCAGRLHYDEEGKVWRNERDRPVCPQGGPHNVFVPKMDFDSLEKFLTEE